MGTRAAFWLGDPVDLEHRKWLGCVAWDGYKWIDSKSWAKIKTEKGFLSAIANIKRTRDDFADPKNGGFPFPWTDDIFLTDVTYAFFDSKVHACWFHHPFFEVGNEQRFEEDDPTHINVPINSEWDINQPDSIMIITRRK